MQVIFEYKLLRRITMSHKFEIQIIPGLSQGSLTASNIIIAHESGNPSNVGARSLESEISFMTNNWRNAFTSHWVGGGGRIVQLALSGKIQYGAGPRANPYAYAQVELARTNDVATFKKDYAAYVWLLRKLADEAAIPKTLDTGTSVSDKGIKSHDWVRKHLGGTTHTDPYAYLASFGISKATFKKDIETGVGTITVTPPKQQVKAEEITKPSKLSWKKTTGNWSGQTLRKGQYGTPVKQLQTKLANNNPPFYPNKTGKNNGIDSYYGDDTKDAVTRFQSYYGLSVDGLAGKEVYNKLTSKSSSKLVASKLPNTTYQARKPYPRGNGVKQVQQALASVYYYPDKGSKHNGIDSVYGPKTADAVRRFQSIHGLKADGIYGKNTRAKLLKVMN